MEPDRFPVVIVGAGGAGLSLALLLQQQGMRPLLVERRPAVSWQPRARNLNFRSLEVLRGLGLSDEIHRRGAPVSRMYAREYLASKEQKELLDPASLLDPRGLSPEPGMWYCPQSRLEPILLDTARDRGVDVRYSTELVDFDLDDSGVTARLKTPSTSGPYSVRAEYLVAADGAHSGIRERLGIPWQGKGTLDEHYTFIYVRGAWADLVRGYETDGFLIQNPGVRGIFLVAEQDLGMLILPQVKTAEPLSREDAHDLTVKAIGSPDVAVEVIEVARWQPEQRVAERFQQGRVFLLGDAAHTMPPKEGLGVNTAIQSAQNLGWKLAAVVAGHASPELLSTYQAERRPVAWFAAQHSMTGPAAELLDKTKTEKKTSEFFPIVGYRYRSSAVIAEASDVPDVPDGEIVLLDREALTGVPGTRMPHVSLERGSNRISSLDLLDGRFVLLTGSSGTEWSSFSATIAAALGTLVAVYQIGPTGDLRDPGDAWARSMGVPSDGAVLIRPDGFVAWRSGQVTVTPDEVEGVLIQVLGLSDAVRPAPSAPMTR